MTVNEEDVEKFQQIYDLTKELVEILDLGNVELTELTFDHYSIDMHPDAERVDEIIYELKNLFS